MLQVSAVYRSQIDVCKKLDENTRILFFVYLYLIYYSYNIGERNNKIWTTRNKLTLVPHATLASDRIKLDYKNILTNIL